MDEMDLKKPGAQKFVIALVAVILFGAGYNLGKSRAVATVPVGSVMNVTAGQPTGVDFAPFWKAWNALNDKYVATGTSTKPVTQEDKVWGAIEGLTSSLGDPYTVFFPPKQAELFASDIRGNFEGVGMEVVAQDGALTVIAPIKGSPAEKAGILPRDRVLKIDDHQTAGLSTDEAVDYIRGPKGSVVTFTIARPGRKEAFDVKVTRDTIDIPTIDTKDLGNGIFKIDLYSFSATSPNLFRGALRQFVESGDAKLILDLRGNPGGYLDAAIDMASWFLPSGKVIVRESFGDGKDETVYRSKGYNVFNNNLKFAILVDQGSASAAEILAGALSEQGVATLVGEKTFGKGSVQELVEITPTTSLKVTVARWLTPNGLSISKQGIVPQVTVSRSEADLKAGRDPQLDKAIEVVNKK
ncbi:MAG: ctpA [Parcubacteria group bacterium]|nr:ctpA [Parcubacteria group bacterium]